MQYACPFYGARYLLESLSRREEARLAEDSQISLLHAGQHECIHIMCMELLNNIFVTCIALSKARYLLLERLASYGTKLSD